MPAHGELEVVNIAGKSKIEKVACMGENLVGCMHLSVVGDFLEHMHDIAAAEPLESEETMPSLIVSSPCPCRN
jgi:hypothetical protein